jgi:hypothetical protein
MELLLLLLLLRRRRRRLRLGSGEVAVRVQLVERLPKIQKHKRRFIKPNLV